MRRTPSALGHSVKIGISLYADAVKAGEAHSMNVGQYVERAVSAQLQRDRYALRVARFETAQREAARTGKSPPFPTDYGLPADFGIPPAFR